MNSDYSNNKVNERAFLVSSKHTEPIYYDLNLHECHNYYYLQNIISWKYKDKRLEFLDIPKELIEVLQNARFTIEKILVSATSEIAKKLQINPYIEKKILKETKEIIGKIICYLLL